MTITVYLNRSFNVYSFLDHCVCHGMSDDIINQFCLFTYPEDIVNLVDGKFESEYFNILKQISSSIEILNSSNITVYSSRFVFEILIRVVVVLKTNKKTINYLKVANPQSLEKLTDLGYIFLNNA